MIGRGIGVLVSGLVLMYLVGSGRPLGAQEAVEPAKPIEEETLARRTLDAVHEDLVALRFEKALATIETLLAEPGLAQGDRIEALVLRAQAHVAYGKLAQAERDYRDILQLRPGYVPDPGLTPSKAMARFEKVRRSLVGTILLALDPPEATVEVDGRETVPGADGRLPVLAGDRRVWAGRRGFDPAETSVKVPAGGEVSLGIRLTPNARAVVVRSEPDGVAVRLDGVDVGMTSRPPASSGGVAGGAELMLEDLPLGEHVFELTKPCYRSGRFEDLLTVDLLDRAPKLYDTVRLEPARGRILLRGGPAGAELRVDGEPAGKLPAEPLEVCPGAMNLEVRSGGRLVWTALVEVALDAEVRIDVTPRPNAVLVGAADWPSGLEDLGASFGSRTGLPLPAELDLSTAEGWKRLPLPPDTDLAFAALPPGSESPGGRRLLYSPILGTVSALTDAAYPAYRPVWQETSIGARLADSRIGGSARVVVVREEGPAAKAGLEPGDRLVAIDGVAIESAKGALVAIAARQPGAALKIELESPSGERRSLSFAGEASPRLLEIPESARWQGAVAAAWAAVDAAASPEAAPSALANLALLLSRSGQHAAAAENWRRTRWGPRRGIGEGTRDYYLARELEALALEREARDAYQRAAGSAATTGSDDGPGVAGAARDHLADLGVTPEGDKRTGSTAR